MRGRAPRREPVTLLRLDALLGDRTEAHGRLGSYKAAMRLIETLAYDDTDEVREILDNVILLVNVCQNPDGRVLGTRANANGVDVNRDFFTQSQPEAQITAGLVAEGSFRLIANVIYNGLE